MRAKRQAPDQDTKGIVSWNALALRAFIQAGLLLGRDDFLLTGKKALNFIESKMFDSSGKFSRIWQNGKVNQPGTLSDYAGLILALHASYEVDFSLETYYKMQLLKEQIQKDFTPDEIYYGSEADINHLIVQLKSLQDNAIPSGNALAAHVHWLLRNVEYNKEDQYRLEQMLGGIMEQANRYPSHFGYWLQIADLYSQKALQIALVTENDLDSLAPFLKKVHATYHPYSVIAGTTQQISENIFPALLKNRTAVKHQAAAYVCTDFTCKSPITDPEVLFELLKG